MAKKGASSSTAKDPKNNTSDDGLGRDKQDLTPEQQAKNDLFDIGPYFLRLYWDEPFFSTIFTLVSRYQDRKFVPTAGVAIVDDRPTFLWNPDFVAPLEDRRILGLLKHEAYHLIYNHCTKRRMDPHVIWNWATDLSINCAIGKDDLPEGGLIPGKHLKKPAPNVWDKMTSEEKQRFENLDKLIFGFPTMKYAEWYFEHLMEDPEIQQMCKEIADAEANAKSLAEAIGKAISDAMSGGQGSHDMWGKAIDKDGNIIDLPDGVRQLIEGEMKEALREAVNRADGGNKWGSVPLSMQGELRALVSNEVDWRQLLRQFVGLSRRSNSKNSRKKINRKVPYVFPGRSRNYTANIAVYIDQSGSVDDTSLQLLYGELRNMAKRTTFHFFPFDTSIDEENAFVWKKGKMCETLGRFRCGGTDFQACVNHLEKNKDTYDAGIICSDGECSKPTPCHKRLAYVIVPGSKLYFEPYPDNIVIQMTGRLSS